MTTIAAPVAAKKKVSTKKILEASIQDIKAGRWTCGVLTKPGDLEKPMGCALGLVGINAGIGTPFFDKDGKCMVKIPYPSEDINSEWTQAAHKAIKLLAQTTKLPAAKLEEVLEAEGVDGVVVGYNDSGDDGSRITKKKALNWFKRALELA